MNRAKVLETMLVLVLALLIVYWFAGKSYWLVVAMALAAVSLLFPSLAKAIHIGWMKMGEAIGFVMNKVILSLVFILFLIPISFLYKLFRKKGGRTTAGQSSYYRTRNYTHTKESMENVW